MTYDRDGEIPCPKCKGVADAPYIRKWGHCPLCRIKELEAIVKKWPKTADGVWVVPGMELWSLLERGHFGLSWASLIEVAENMDLLADPPTFDGFYSTLSAAEAAAKGAGT